ncbi:MAG: hypothetical protein ACRDNZ_07585 [Streptosporangiaceae bacterium]
MGYALFLDPRESARGESEQHEALRAEHRVPGALVRQPRHAITQQACDAHLIENARAGGVRRVQVGIPVEVNQAEVGGQSLQTGDRPERDGAVPAEHDRHAPSDRRELLGRVVTGQRGTLIMALLSAGLIMLLAL